MMRSAVLLSLSVSFLAWTAACATARAAEPDVTGLAVQGAWVRLPPPGANAAGYLRFDNTSSAERRIVGVASDVAARTEIHRSSVEDGVARMRRIDALTVPAGGHLVLQPQGLHVMLINPQALVEGQTVELRFDVEGHGPLFVVAEVRRTPPAAGP